MFDYDRDILQPPEEEHNELDPNLYVYIGCGMWYYIGDEV